MKIHIDKLKIAAYNGGMKGDDAVHTKMPNRCPACGGELRVKALQCASCKTVVEGEYILSKFLTLTDDQLRFCELLIRNRGNLKDVCAALGISYPTARNRMDDLVRALGYEDRPSTGDRMQILERLTRGEITHAQALELLKEE